MRRILIENARRKAALRHGGGQRRVEFDGVLEIASFLPDDQLLALDEVLDKLAAHQPRRAEVVKLRHLMGITARETAEVPGISADRAKDDTAYALAWLRRGIKKSTVCA